MRRKLVTAALAAALIVGAASQADASLTTSYQFNGEGNWSIDAVGSNNSPVGTVSAVVPVGSTVVRAFLYSSQFGGNPSRGTPNVTLGGTSYSGGDWTSMGANPVVPGFTLEAWRADVTAQMVSAIGGGGVGPFNFSVTENSLNTVTDGEVLVVVYSNAGEQTRTIAILDGFSDVNGDSTSINFANPLTGVGDPGFEALLSLGIGYSAGGSQFSLVDGNGRRLTSTAGGFDDGAGVNGGLITAGGLGDSSANPNPASGPDDELYDLGQGNSADANPFLSNGLNSYTFRTINPSHDDNIFFLGLNITAEADVNPVVPLPPAALAGLGMLGLMGLMRRRRKVR